MPAKSDKQQRFAAMSATPKGRKKLPEITPEMIEAGVTVLWECGRFDPVGEPDRLLVREMLEAALARKPMPVKVAKEFRHKG